MKKTYVLIIIVMIGIGLLMPKILNSRKDIEKGFNSFKKSKTSITALIKSSIADIQTLSNL